MKLNLRSALPLVLVVALFYAGCKKSENKTPSGPNNDEVSAAISKNLVQALSGAYGGASIKDGVSASANLAAASPKLKTQALVQCGFFTDNSLDVTYKQGDSIKTHTTGSVNYFFICNSGDGNTVGYDLTDSLNSSGKGPGYAFSFVVVQDYKVRGLNLANSNFTLNGRLKSWVDFDYTSKPKSSTSVHNVFHFIDAEVHADDNYDIVGGDATFKSQGVTSTGVSWDYSGTIHFLGNHKAKLTFLNKQYLVDLLTGTVTPV